MELLNLRKQKKLTQDEVAKFLNMSQSAYQHYENNRAEPNIDTLCKLADFYGVSLDYLVGREFGNDIGYLTPDQKNIVFVLKKLNENNLNTILSTALKLLDEQK